MAGVQVMALKETRAIPDENRGHIPARKLHRFERLPAIPSAPVHWRQRFQLADVPGLGDFHPGTAKAVILLFLYQSRGDQLRIRIETAQRFQRYRFTLSHPLPFQLGCAVINGVMRRNEKGHWCSGRSVNVHVSGSWLMRFRAAAAARGEPCLNVENCALGQAHKLFEVVSFCHMDMAELFIDAAAEGVEIGAAHRFWTVSAQFLQLSKAAELQNVRFLL